MPPRRAYKTLPATHIADEALFAMTGRAAGKARAVTHSLLTVHSRFRHAAV